MTVLAWSPLRGGMLTGKYLAGAENAAGTDARLNHEMMAGFVASDERSLRTVRETVAIAKELGATPAQVALAWLRYRPVPVIPIIGARKMAQLEDNLKSLELSLSPEQLKRLDEVSAVEPGFPNDFFAKPMVRTFAYGGLRDRIAF